jgi:hypothetical protein
MYVLYVRVLHTINCLRDLVEIRWYRQAEVVLM